MDFRTEWSSWLMVVAMLVISFVTCPDLLSSNLWYTIGYALGVTIVSIAMACIPVLIVCYFIKVIPDIDYSIRLAFAYMIVVLLIYHI